jgi:hypothetical protein
MISAKSLTEDQRSAILRWGEEGYDLAGIHRKLADELGLKLTYMDARLLVAELEVPLPERESSKPREPEVVKAVDDEAENEEVGGVKVRADELARPGMVLSGKVTFSDGESGEWYVDQYGRLGLRMPTPGYQPSADDAATFQRQLGQIADQLGL